MEVSGGVLTVAWGIEGAALLGAGFPLRDRALRLSGLALFLICIVKLFAHDLQALGTVYRILSFMALGAILVSVSWLYTRFSRSHSAVPVGETPECLVNAKRFARRRAPANGPADRQK